MVNALAVPGPSSRWQQPGAGVAGFWAGVWHGMICPITLIVSIFAPGVRIYEQHNRGRLYDLGFLIGASAALGGGARSTAGYPIYY